MWDLVSSKILFVTITVRAWHLFVVNKRIFTTGYFFPPGLGEDAARRFASVKGWVAEACNDFSAFVGSGCWSCSWNVSRLESNGPCRSSGEHHILGSKHVIPVHTAIRVAKLGFFFFWKDICGLFKASSHQRSLTYQPTRLAWMAVFLQQHHMLKNFV